MSRQATTVELWQQLCELAQHDDVDFGEHGAVIALIVNLPREFPTILLDDTAESKESDELFNVDTLIDRMTELATAINALDVEAKHRSYHEYYVESGETGKTGFNSGALLTLRNATNTVTELAEKKMAWPPQITDHTSFSYALLRAFNGYMNACAKFEKFAQVQDFSWGSKKVLLRQVRSRDSRATARETVEGCLEACSTYVETVIAASRRRERIPPPSPIVTEPDGAAAFAGEGDEGLTAMPLFGPPSPITSPAGESKVALTTFDPTVHQQKIRQARAILIKIQTYIQVTQHGYNYTLFGYTQAVRDRQSHAFKRVKAFIGERILLDDCFDEHRSKMLATFIRDIAKDFRGIIWQEFHDLLHELADLAMDTDAEIHLKQFSLAVTEAEYDCATEHTALLKQ